MATVTKVIRWGEPVNHDSVGGAGLAGLAGGGGSNSSTSPGTGLNMPDSHTLVGLRMVASPSLVRDGGCGGIKLFALIPQGITTVREFKNHLSTNILKTHIPFYFYNGDYRIPDEEDIRIFSLLNEPCKVVPVPQPKSALSVSSVSALNGSAIFASTSTPLPIRGVSSIVENGFIDRRIGGGTPFSAAKRVKFSSDTSFPLDICEFSSINNTDRDEADAAVDNNNGNNDLVPADPDAASATTTVTKRRKRHRKHKSKKNSNNILVDAAGEDTEEDSTSSSTQQQQQQGCSKKSSGIQQGQGPLLKKRKSTGPSEYDADESEMDLSQVRHKRKSPTTSPPTTTTTTNTVVNGGSNNNNTEETSCVDGSNNGNKNNKSLEKSGEFLSPTTAFSESGGYKRIRTSSSLAAAAATYGNNNNKGGGYPKPASSGGSGSAGSGFQHSHGEEGDDGQNECDGIETSSGKRKDTPMLPKILKNPCATFELVKKTLSFEGASFSPESPPPSADVSRDDMDLTKLIEEIQETISPTSKKLGVKVECRSIRIGDYKCSAPSTCGKDTYPVVFSEKGILFILPHARNRQRAVVCALDHQNILFVDSNYKKPLPVMFLATGPRVTKNLGTRLGLSVNPNDHGYHYDPQDGDDCQRRIVFLFTTINEQAAATINKIFGSTLTEISSVKANEMLCEVTRDKSEKPSTAEEMTDDGWGHPILTDPRTIYGRHAVATTSTGGETNSEISKFLIILGPVASVDLIKIGDTISFKVLELNENYTPELSALKVAEILDRNGDVLELNYLTLGNSNQQKQPRSGVFEIEDDDELESEELDNPKSRNFVELMSPTFVLVKDK